MKPDLRREQLLDVIRCTVELLAPSGTRVLVTIDHISEERMAMASRPSLARPLPPDQVREMLGLIDEVCDMALAVGVRAAMHQHAGCYIEVPVEMEAVLAAVEPERLGLCVDTGHMTYAGLDPVVVFRRHSAHTTYLHLKGVDPQVLEWVKAERIPFLPATALGVFCSLGRGGFDGAATVEQDVDPAVGPSPLADTRESLAHLRRAGFQEDQVAAPAVP